MKKFIFAVAIACVGAQIIHAEQVQYWFKGYVEGSSTKAENGAWPAETPADVTVAADKFTLDTSYDYVATLDFAPKAAAAPDTNVVTRVVTEAKFTPVTGTMPTFTDFTEIPKTALGVSNANYYAYAKVGDGMGWVVLTNDDVTVSANTVTVLAEIDYKVANAPRARFGIIDGTTTNYLKAVGAADDSWLTLATPSSVPDIRLVSKVSFMGSGEVALVKGDVQLGIFENNDVKYGTANEAVEAAQASGGSSKITVIRDNDEDIVIPEGSTIALDTNGKTCGEIENNGDDPVQIALPAEYEGQGSTEPFVIDVKGDPDEVEIYTSDKSKEVLVTTNDKGQLVGMVRTSYDIMTNVVFDGKAVADPNNADYRAFLTNYCGAAGGAYMKANTTAAEITTQLGTNADNGLPLWESYVLDLDPTDSASKPAAVVKPATEDAKNMILTVPTYKSTLPESNYTVKYMLETIGGSSTQIDNPAQITIPFDGNQYRVNTVIVPNSAQ